MIRVDSEAGSEDVRGVRLNPHPHPPIWLKIPFSWDILARFDKFVYRIQPKYSHPLLFILYFSLTSLSYYIWLYAKLLDEWQTV